MGERALAYRDENEQLRARVKVLEDDLAAARKTVAELEGQRTGQPSLARAFLGADTELKVEREVSGTLDEDTCEQVIDALAERFGCEGALTRVGRRVVWTASGGSRMLDVSLTERGGRVRIRARERTGNLAGGVFGGVGGGLGGGASAIIALAAEYGGVPLAVAIPVWILAVLLLARSIYARLCHRRERQLHAAMSFVESIVARSQRDEPARIDIQGAAPRDEDAEAEALAADEQDAERGQRSK